MGQNTDRFIPVMYQLRSVSATTYCHSMWYHDHFSTFFHGRQVDSAIKYVDFGINISGVLSC